MTVGCTRVSNTDACVARPRPVLPSAGKDTGMSLTDTFSLPQDRLQWRAVALAAKATRTSLTDCPWSKNKCRKKRIKRTTC